MLSKARSDTAQGTESDDERGPDSGSGTPWDRIPNLIGKIKETSGSITWSLDDKYIFYSKLDKYHRARKIYRHTVGSRTEKDKLIYEEKDEGFTCGIGISSDEKYYFIATSDHTTSEIYFFNVRRYRAQAARYH